MTSEIIVRKANHEYKYIDPALQNESLEAARDKVVRGCFQPLTAEREAGVFLLFLLGDDIATVAKKAGIPKEVVSATADSFGWSEKRDLISGGESPDPAKGIQLSIVNMILAATAVAVRKEIEGVLAGTLDPKESTYIPNSIHGLSKLVQLMHEIEGIQPNALPGQGGTSIQTQNVNILQQVAPESNEAKEFSAQERSAFLKTLADVKK